MLEHRATVDTYTIAVKLAGMVLMQNGQITLGEIQNLPFVQSKQEAYAIAQRLARAFGSRYHIEVAEDAGGAETRLMLTALHVDANLAKASV